MSLSYPVVSGTVKANCALDVNQINPAS
uniref:Uncharacterized protein n=1 Tax=Anguilla anguilla TaxID=7936 RepID=A0A0E9SXK3_ANGAN